MRGAARAAPGGRARSRACAREDLPGEGAAEHGRRGGGRIIRGSDPAFKARRFGPGRRPRSWALRPLPIGTGPTAEEHGPMGAHVDSRPPAEAQVHRILLVGDRDADAERIRDLLASSDARPPLAFAHAHTLSQAFETLDRNEADVLLMDVGAGGAKEMAAVSQARVR